MNTLQKWLLILITFALIGSVWSVFPKETLAQMPVFSDKVNIEQKDLLQGKYPLRKVLESGGQFFSVPYTEKDHVGEGETGSRSVQRHTFYPISNGFPFLRVNGLDSQSCFECHNTIGVYREPGTVSSAKLRKPGVTGGSAGVVSNAFINPDFPHTLTGLIRNPPHVFGTGYTQTLASEMTYELQAQKIAVQKAAKQNPGQTQSMALKTKNIDFGVFSSVYDPKTDQFTDDTSKVEGVSKDLVIRPFQWKGISSSMRNFHRDATDFHFSVQAEEKVGYLDCDKDGFPKSGQKTNEITVGNISALSAFVAMTRPPVEETNDNSAKGRKIFENTNCITCHVPKLTVKTPVLVIDNPVKSPSDITSCPNEVTPTLGTPQPWTKDLPVMRQFQAYYALIDEKNKNAIKTTAETAIETATPTKPEEIYRDTIASFDRVKRNKLETLLDRQHPDDGGVRSAAIGSEAPPEADRSTSKGKNSLETPESGYTIDLSAPGRDLPSYVYDRLPTNTDGSVDVPLFSDLRTHNMGQNLKDFTTQGTDVEGIVVEPERFLTRPLWGVGDTGPWLHDGRARSLEEAILLHESEGSEANPVIENFKKLSQDDRQALVDFLLSLRLPIQKGLTIVNNIPPEESSARQPIGPVE